eukprot:364425-Amphidinium_carterae.1
MPMCQQKCDKAMPEDCGFCCMCLSQLSSFRYPRASGKGARGVHSDMGVSDGVQSRYSEATGKFDVLTAWRQSGKP